MQRVKGAVPAKHWACFAAPARRPHGAGGRRELGDSANFVYVNASRVLEKDSAGNVPTIWRNWAMNEHDPCLQDHELLLHLANPGRTPPGIPIWASATTAAPAANV